MKRTMKKSIEDIIVDKIYSTINAILAKKIKPDIQKNNVTELSEEEIDMLKEQYGIEGIILDVDNTLRTKMQEIKSCNEEWLDMIRKKLKVIIVSNGLDGNMERFFRLKGIHYIGFAHKPLKKNFYKACQLMDLQPCQILVIGDDVISDIYMGKRFGTKTLHVLGVRKHESEDEQDK